MSKSTAVLLFSPALKHDPPYLAWLSESLFGIGSIDRLNRYILDDEKLYLDASGAVSELKTLLPIFGVNHHRTHILVSRELPASINGMAALGQAATIDKWYALISAMGKIDAAILSLNCNYEGFDPLVVVASDPHRICRLLSTHPLAPSCQPYATVLYGPSGNPVVAYQSIANERYETAPKMAILSLPRPQQDGIEQVNFWWTTFASCVGPTGCAVSLWRHQGDRPRTNNEDIAKVTLSVLGVNSVADDQKYCYFMVKDWEQLVDLAMDSREENVAIYLFDYSAHESDVTRAIGHCVKYPVWYDTAVVGVSWMASIGRGCDCSMHFVSHDSSVMNGLLSKLKKYVVFEV